nr:FkbM family methyltransferase [uncultured Draconibacterium sp.]
MKIIEDIINLLLLPIGLKANKIDNKKEYRAVKKARRKYKRQEKYKSSIIIIGNYQISITNFDSASQMYTDLFVNETHVVSFDSANPLIYDLGANIGIASLYYKSRYPNAEIKAYEPNPIVFKALEENIKINNLTNVHAYNNAISNEEGHLVFYCDRGGQVSSFLKPNGFQTIPTKIPAIRLKTLIENETQQIDLIKIDIEGVEVKVLQDCGNLLKKVDRLVIEYHSYKEGEQELSRLFKTLEDNNFRYIIKSGAFADFDLSNHDNKRSHFDIIIHIEAIKNDLLKSN